jgi:hypothetical protein
MTGINDFYSVGMISETIEKHLNVSFDNMAKSGRASKNINYAHFIIANLLTRQNWRVIDIARLLSKSRQLVIYYKKQYDNEIKYNKDFQKIVEAISAELETEKQTKNK